MNKDVVLPIHNGIFLVSICLGVLEKTLSRFYSNTDQGLYATSMDIKTVFFEGSVIPEPLYMGLCARVV